METTCVEKEGELIDTLWNVNKKDGTFNVYDALELIDTLWNVNAICFWNVSGIYSN